MTTWELQQRIHDAVKENLSAGMTEKELGEVISKVTPVWQGDLISGERTAEIEGAPGDRIIKNGDVVLLDLQVYSDNMWSDLTRVYFVGDVTDEQKKAYELVLKAIKAGEEKLCDKTLCKEIKSCMQKAIDCEYAFTHHGGHAIDSEHFYMKPAFVEESEETLEVGMTVTLEPAIYYPGKFGIRLENNYIITEKGYERLDKLSLDLSDYIVKG